MRMNNRGSETDDEEWSCLSGGAQKGSGYEQRKTI